MNILLHCYESYPVYGATEAGEQKSRYIIDVPKETFERWERIYSEYHQMQNEIESKWDECLNA